MLHFNKLLSAYLHVFSIFTFVFLSVKFRNTKRVGFEKDSFLSKASFQSFRGVFCSLPAPLSRNAMIQRSLRGYSIRVSNDGIIWSKALHFTVYDGLCFECKTDGHNCHVKVGKYIIEMVHLKMIKTNKRKKLMAD